MIARGNRIVVEPKLAVFHSHGETLPQLLSKYLIWLGIKSRIKSLERPECLKVSLETRAHVSTKSELNGRSVNQSSFIVQLFSYNNVCKKLI